MSETTIGQPCAKVKDELLEQIAPQVETLVKEFTWAGLFAVFDDVVQAVEDAGDIGTGPEKKACAVDITLAVYDKYQFDIPYLPNMFERQMLKLIVEIAIDGIVAILNKRGLFVHGT
jgi:ketopantoate reductase